MQNKKNNHGISLEFSNVWFYTYNINLQQQKGDAVKLEKVLFIQV